MTTDEVLATFPKEATRISPEVKLADGNTIGAAIDGFAFEGLTFDVRFIFEGGKLALVSLRTPQKKYVDADGYTRIREALVKKWGQPLEDTRDDNFIDLLPGETRVLRVRAEGLREADVSVRWL